MQSVTYARWVRVATTLLLLSVFGAALGACGAQRMTARQLPRAFAAQALAPLDATPTPTSATGATGATTPTASVTATPVVTPVTPAFGAGGPPVAPPALSATSAELYDASTGKTLLALAQDTSLPMASTTKIMTAVVALTYGRLDQPITVGPDVIAIENGGTSIAGLQLGETLSLRELLYCLLLPSGDDAAVAIADGVVGSQTNFVALMNLEAGLLGLSHTHYANPHGLDAPGHFTSASDLVRLTQYAMTSPTFAQIVDTPSITLPATATHHEFQLVNTNELLSSEPFAYTGAIGVKTGFTGGAGYCLVFMAQRPSGALIGVVLGEPTYDARFTDATALLDWAYGLLTPAPTPTPTATGTGIATATATP